MIIVYDKCVYFKKGKKISSVPNSKYFCTIRGRIGMKRLTQKEKKSHTDRIDKVEGKKKVYRNIIRGKE